MRTILAAVCAFTLLATGYLSLSVLILHPPRVNYAMWLLMAALFAAQGGLTLTTLAGLVRGASIRWLLLAGGVAIILVGASWVRDTVSGPHFEGYALVLGAALVMQGALTLGAFLRPQDVGPPAARATGPAPSARPASARPS